MGAVLVMGKDLHFVRPAEGSDWLEIEGDPYDVTNIAYSSVAEVEEVAERALGIAPSCWPFYMEIDVEGEVPLEDVRRKCDHLRGILGACSPEDLPEHFWLRFLADILRRGWDFFAYP